jgi:hypothetical protein
MKNLKKVLSIVLAVSMMLSTFTVAFASEASDAQTLYNLGRLDDVSTSALSETLTRVIGVTMVMKALGYTQADADAVEADCTFTDLEGDYAWAKGWVQLAYNEGITLGTVKGIIFNPSGTLTAQEFVAFLLRALGYDTVDAYDEAAAIGAAAGITTDFADTDYTKGEASVAMLDALSAKLQDESGMTLIEKLVADGVVSLDAAIAAGLMAEATFAPKLTYADEDGILKADGASSTLVTFTLKDSLGNTITDAEDVEVAFTTTFGNFGETRVTVQNGVATVILTSEFLTTNHTATLRGEVVEAADADYIGLVAEAKIIMSPNPDEIDSETLGASMTGAEASQADRVILYFNKPVDVTDYL